MLLLKEGDAEAAVPAPSLDRWSVFVFLQDFFHVTLHILLLSYSFTYMSVNLLSNQSLPTVCEDLYACSASECDTVCFPSHIKSTVESKWNN